MNAVQAARSVLDSLATPRGRSVRHILIGLGVTAGAVAASAVIARRNLAADEEAESHTDYQPAARRAVAGPSAVFPFIWPPLFLALAISGVRIWKAPKSAARSQALTLWAFVQGLNALWMALGARRLGVRLATATSALGTTGAYVWRARKADPRAAAAAAASAGWAGVAGALSGDLRRKSGPKPTLH